MGESLVCIGSPVNCSVLLLHVQSLFSVKGRRIERSLDRAASQVSLIVAFRRTVRVVRADVSATEFSLCSRKQQQQLLELRCYCDIYY